MKIEIVNAGPNNNNKKLLTRVNQLNCLEDLVEIDVNDVLVEVVLIQTLVFLYRVILFGFSLRPVQNRDELDVRLHHVQLLAVRQFPLVAGISVHDSIQPRSVRFYK